MSLESPVFRTLRFKELGNGETLRRFPTWTYPGQNSHRPGLRLTLLKEIANSESCEGAGASLALILPDRSSTQLLGRALADAVTTHAIIALNGPLGAGKTTLVQGMALALGIKEAVNSPTFTMLNEYHSGRLPLYHLDLYRLTEDAESVSDMLAAELDQFIDQKMIAVMEWADLFTLKATARSYFYQLDHLVVNIDYVEEVKPSEEGSKNSPSFYMENGRKANLTAFGGESCTLISTLKKTLAGNLKIL